MRIGIFTTSFLPYHSRLGISNAVYFLVKNLIKKYDCDIYVYSSDMKGLKNREEYRNLHIKRFPYESRYQFSPEMLNIHEIDNIDLIHSFHYGFFPAFAGLLAAKRTHKPHLFTTAYHPPIYTPFRSLISRMHDVLQGFWVLKYSDMVLPFNKDEKTHLEKYVNTNYNIIPCPVNSDVFFPYRKEQKKITIAYVGPMLPWKGAWIAFDIFRKIEKERNDVRFVFIGMGHLEDEIKRKSGNRFTFIKDIQPTELAKQYNSIDILVSPTYYESFGCVLAEAGMCGTPVVSTRVGGIPETVGSCGLLVDYGDWKKMKEYIEMLIDDAKLRKKLGKNAIAHTKKFRDGIVSENIYRVYKRLLSNTI